MVTNRIALGNGTWDGALRLDAQIPVSVGSISSDRLQANVQAANQGQITAYEAFLTANGYQPTNLGNVPEPPPPTPPTPPTPDEITRDAEVATAFNTIMEAEISNFTALVAAEYANISTTAEPFLMKFDIKHLRQRAR